MNVRLLTGVGAIVATGATVAALALAPSAVADTPQNPGCGAALLVLSQADKAASDAAAADSAAADAKKADDALADATSAVDAARAAALNGGASTADLADNGAALRAAKKAILDLPGDPTQAQSDEIVKIDAKLALIEAFTTAQTRAAAAKAAADKTDAEALRREADKTDTAALVAAAGKAGDAADVACGRNNGVRFETCDQVRLAGKAPLRSTEPGYRARLDPDRDGLACEAVEGTPRTPVRLPSAVDTGWAA